MKKKSSTSPLQALLTDKEILTKRPEGMEYAEYRILLKIQQKIIKKALQ